MSSELALTNDTPAQAITSGGLNAGVIDMRQLETEMRLADMIAGSSMVPKAYQGQPGNVLIAWGLGASMGLGRMESLYRIDVIQGTPAASAELIASNTRKAGHKLVVRVDEEAMSVTATITRWDQPDEPYVVTRDMAWAKQMGLAGKDNYVKQPLTMLQWRAISACARLACSEALYGVGYTPDELRESVVQGKVTQASSARRARSSAAALAPEPQPAALVGGDHGQQDTGAAPSMSPEQAQDLTDHFSALGITSAVDRGRFIEDTIGRKTSKTNPPTSAEAEVLIETLRDLLNKDGR